jgi:hypothetical protein
MKRFALVAALLLSGGAYAQPPKEMTASDTVRLSVGQSRTFVFDEPVADFKLVANGIAQVLPQTDKTFTVEALKQGDVLAIAYGADGRVINSMNISVVPAPSVVKIYGSDRKLSVGGYSSYYCSDTGCSRANPDVEEQPYSTSISETQNKGGNSVTTSREYR